MYTICMLAGINAECKLREIKGCQPGLEPGLPLIGSTRSCSLHAHTSFFELVATQYCKL